MIILLQCDSKAPLPRSLSPEIPREFLNSGGFAADRRERERPNRRRPVRYVNVGAASVQVHADPVESHPPPQPTVGVRRRGARRALPALRQGHQHQVQCRRQQEPGLRRIRRAKPGYFDGVVLRFVLRTCTDSWQDRVYPVFQ